MVKSLKIIITGFIKSIHFISYNQSIDTLNLIVSNPSGNNFSIIDKRIFIRKSNGLILRNPIQVTDSIMNLRSTKESNVVYMRLFNKRNKLYSTGLWNEEGYQSTIYFYKRNGSMKYKGHWQEGVFYRDE